jgi:predicted transcriptional regulator
VATRATPTEEALGIPTKLGDLQLAIMREVWKRGQATVAEVHEALLAERGLALTTIATMLKKMEAKGVVTHHSQGRRFIYAPVVSEEEVTRSMVSELTDRLFQGEPLALVSHLLSEHDLGSEELADLKKMIAAARAQGRKTE